MGDHIDFTVPPGYYEPFTIISENDHGGYILIASALGLAMALLSTAIRIYAKLLSRQKAGTEDALLAAGTLFAFVMQGVILHACSRGLGKAVKLLSTEDLRAVEKSFYVGQILTVLALGLCKCSVACFIARLTPQTYLRRGLNVLIACIVAWMFASILSLALQCDLVEPWGLASGECEGVFTRILVVGILDCVLEVVLFMFAILLVSRLQTKLMKRLVVIAAFALRLPLIPLIAARLSTFNQFDIRDFSRSESLYIVWTVSQINYSLISTTLPILRPLIKELTTFYGALRPSEYSGSEANSRSNSVPLSTFRTRQSDGTKISRGSVPHISLNTDRVDSIDFGVPQQALERSTFTETEATRSYRSANG